MNEKNSTHANMVLRLASGLTSAQRVAEATGNLGELRPMIQSTYSALLTCGYRDEEDFREARLKAADITDAMSCDGYSEWVRAETSDLIRDLNTIHDGFVA